jgi:hypothetical protein
MANNLMVGVCSKPGSFPRKRESSWTFHLGTSALGSRVRGDERSLGHARSKT